MQMSFYLMFMHYCPHAALLASKIKQILLNHVLLHGYAVDLYQAWLSFADWVYIEYVMNCNAGAEAQLC